MANTNHNDEMKMDKDIAQKYRISDELMQLIAGGEEDDDTLDKRYWEVFDQQYKQPDGSYLFVCNSQLKVSRGCYCPCTERIVGLNRQAFRNKVYAHIEWHMQTDPPAFH